MPLWPNWIRRCASDAEIARSNRAGGTTNHYCSLNKKRRIEMVKPKVLIVEDLWPVQKFLQECLTTKVRVLSAFTIKEARGLFTSNPDLKLIVMDACVPEDAESPRSYAPNTPLLVREFRQSFKGPMIAMSNVAEYQTMLIDAGCNYKRGDKVHLPEEILRILGILFPIKRKDKRSVYI